MYSNSFVIERWEKPIGKPWFILLQTWFWVSKEEGSSLKNLNNVDSASSNEKNECKHRILNICKRCLFAKHS